MVHQSLGVHSLDHFALAVPDLGVARDFYETFGLDARDDGDRLELRVHGNPHCWGIVVKGEAKRLHHLSFGAWPQDIPHFERRLAEMGIAHCPAPDGFAGEGLWLRGPDEVLIQIRAAAKTSAEGKSSTAPAIVAAGARGAAMGSASVALVRPRRLSH